MADVLICPSLALKKFAESYWGLTEKNIKVVPNPFSLQESLFHFPVDGRPKVISFIGKLSILKGMKTLTAAIPGILKNNKDYTLYIVGRNEIEDGKSMLAYMQQELAPYKKQVIFTGALPKEELLEIYAKSRVCIFPSLWENYPSVILEAMAGGAAVVAANAGGIPEMIRHQNTGILFDPMVPRDLFNAVSALLDDNTKRVAIAGRARTALRERLADPGFEKEISCIYLQFENKPKYINTKYD
jgi:glycosyltransferase involved in cell wall biosynthesis